MANKITMKNVQGRKIRTVKTANSFYYSNIKSDLKPKNIIPKVDLFESLGIRSI